MLEDIPAAVLLVTAFIDMHRAQCIVLAGKPRCVSPTPLPFGQTAALCEICPSNWVSK